MVIFDELRITNDGQHLIIDCRIRKENWYNTVYIGGIYIDTEETYEEGGPSKRAAIFAPTMQQLMLSPKKTMRFVYDKSDLKSLFLANPENKGVSPDCDLTKHLFFVYVKAFGTPAADTPCGMDDEYTLGVTMYMGKFYNDFMNSLKNINSTCSGGCDVPSDIVDQLLQYMALTVSIDSGHYLKGIEEFKKWYTGKSYTNNSTKKCGCHG